MSDQTLRLVNLLRARLEATRRKITIFEALAGVLLTAGVLLAIWFLSVSLEAGFWLSPMVRLVLLSALVVVVLGLLAVYVVLPFARFKGWIGMFSEHHVARLIGTAFPDVSDRMVNFLQLTEGAHSNAPSEMLDRAVSELGSVLQPVPFERIASLDRVKRIGMFSFIPLLAIIVFAGASPSTFSGASQRLLSPNTFFSKPAPFAIVVTPGDVDVIRGDSVAVSASIVGSSEARDLTLEYEFAGEIRTRTVNLVATEDGAYPHTFPALRQSLRYRIFSEVVGSDWFNITVTERPIVQRLDVTLYAPAYSRLPAQELETNVGDVTALAGTRAELRIAASGAEVSSAEIQFENGSSIELLVDGNRISGNIGIERTTKYRISLLSTDGIVNADPISYEIVAIEDDAPTVSFLYPEPQSEITSEALVPFAVRFSDDYGFSSIRLFHRLAESRFETRENEFTSIPLLLSEPYLLDQILDHPWSLREESGFDPLPGDVIEYYVRVRDNNRIRGFQDAVTPTHVVRFPSLAEQYDQLDDSQDETENALEELLDEASQIRDQFQELKEDLRQKPEADWQDERRLDQLQEQQQELESSVEDISSGIQEMIEDMSQNDLVSEETIEMFQELREVVDEVNSPELMDALRNLENSLENMNLNETQQNLEEFEFSEEMYMERLDRALELFKNLRLQQDLEEAQKRTEDLVELEDKLQEETAALQNEQSSKEGEEAGENTEPEEKSGDPGAEQEQKPDGVERLSAEQREAAKDMEAIEKKLEEILEQMEEMGSPATDQMQDLEEDTKDRQLPQQMEKAANEMQEQNFEQAQQTQEQVKQQMSQIQGELGEMQQNMQGQQLQMNLTGLRASLSDVLILSERQEELRLNIAAIRSESPQLRTAAQKQVELSDGLSTVADSLQRLARKIPQMSRDVQQESGEALREMSSAVDQLTERSSRNATGHQKGAMTHLNELALILSELLDQMSNGQSSSGSGMSMEQLMEQLQQMGDQQKSLNDQIQQLLNDAQGNRLTTDMIDRMKQLGSQQDQIRRDLKQINRDRSARNKLLGDLNKLADQMQESVQELLQNRSSRQLMQRQRQILTRLLEASRSLQEQGKEKKRESRTGADLDRLSPPELTPAEKVEMLRRELFRALESGYSSDYELLIRRYFELLQQESDAGR